MANGSPLTAEVREVARRDELGAYRRTFRRSAAVTFLQGGVPLLLGAGLSAVWLSGRLAEGQWWLGVVGGVCLAFGLFRTGQATQARRSPVHLFGAGLVAGRPGAVQVFRFDDVEIFRESRREALVQVVYTVRRRSDGRSLKLENVLQVEKLVAAIQDGPVWEPELSEAGELAADRAARAADQVDERAGMAKLRVLALVPVPIAVILAVAGAYFLTQVGEPPRCNGELMRPTDRCALIDDDPNTPASLDFAGMRARQDGRNQTYAVASFGLTVLCAGPAVVSFWPRRRR